MQPDQIMILIVLLQNFQRENTEAENRFRWL